MARPRLYFDEDSMQRGLVVALRARRVEVITASEAFMTKKSDEEQLRWWAAANGFVLYSFNLRDYQALHASWLARGNPHGGIVLAHQQRYTVGEQLRRLLLLLDERTAEDMRNRLEYLSGWDDDQVGAGNG